MVRHRCALSAAVGGQGGPPPSGRDALPACRRKSTSKTHHRGRRSDYPRRRSDHPPLTKRPPRSSSERVRESRRVAPPEDVVERLVDLERAEEVEEARND